MDASKHQWLFSAPIRALGRLPESAPSWPRRRAKWLALVAAFAITAAWPTSALTAGESSSTSKTLVLDDGRKFELIVGPAFKGNVRDLPTAKRWEPGDPVREVNPLYGRLPTKTEGIQLEPDQPKLDPLLERQESALKGEETRASSPPDREGGSYGCQ